LTQRSKRTTKRLIPVVVEKLKASLEGKDRLVFRPAGERIVLKISEDELLKIAKREVGVYPVAWGSDRIAKPKWLRQLERWGIRALDNMKSKHVKGLPRR